MKNLLKINLRYEIMLTLFSNLFNLDVMKSRIVSVKCLFDISMINSNLKNTP